MRLAGRNQALPRLSVTEAIHFMQQTGYDVIELSLLRGNGSYLTELTEDFMIRHVLECIQEKPEFCVSAVSCHANYAVDDFVYQLQQRLLRTVRRYGTDIVIVSTYINYADRERRREELWAQLIDRTRHLCSIAEREGVRLAIEPEPNSIVSNLADFFRLAEAVDSPALKMNFDVGHAYLCEPDVEGAILRAKDYIVHGHIDNMRRGEHCHLLPWDGEIDLAAACRSLKQHGFDGTLALDLYIHDYAAVSADCVRYIKDNVYGR